MIRIPVRFLWLAALLLSACARPDASPSAADRTGEGRYLNHDPSVGYIGREGCMDCHADQYVTYVESQMGRSFKPALYRDSDADFDDPNPIYDPHQDLHYRPFRKGDSLFIREYRLSGRDTVYQRVEKIDYIVGSGQHTNSHMMEVNGYLYQMPSTFYTQEQRWDLPPGFHDGHNHRFERAIESECMTCHNAMPGYVEGSDNRYDWLRHGIDCERCHGPGELHDATIRRGKVVDTRTEVDWTIVNPGKLPQDLQYDLCQRCHLQGIAVPREGKTFMDFRPGMRLRDVINVFFPRYTDSLSQFIMASHPDRMSMSACRSASVAGSGPTQPLTCVTCHDPHVAIELQGANVYNDACLSCHGEAVTVCTESESVRARVGDDCVSCHMPLTASMDIPHVKITDHFIRKPDDVSADKTVEVKEFVRLASLTEPNPSNRLMGDGYLTYYEQFNTIPRYLDSAAVYLNRARAENPAEVLAPSLVRLWFLQEKHEAVARLADEMSFDGMDEPWMFYRIGEAFSKIGRPDRAVAYYEWAVSMGPDHLWFRTKLAGAYISTDRISQGVSILDQVLSDNHKFHPAYNNRGYGHVLLGDLDSAESDFQKAIALDPDSKQTLANLASLYLNKGEPERAHEYALRLIELDPDNPQYTALIDLLSGAE